MLFEYDQNKLLSIKPPIKFKFVLIIMKYDIQNIVNELKSLKTEQEKKVFIERTVKEIRLSMALTLSKKPVKRVDHIVERINYLEDIFALKSILAESMLTEKQ